MRPHWCADGGSCGIGSALAGGAKKAEAKSEKVADTASPAANADDLAVEDKNGSPYVIAVDEGWWDMAGAFSVVDIADLSAPRLVKTVEMPEGKERGIWQPHQPHEEIIEGFAFVAWFSHGLVVVDVSDPANAQRVAHHLPAMRSEFGPLSNDVFVDKANRRVYLLDRVRGLEILEYDVR